MINASRSSGVAASLYISSAALTQATDPAKGSSAVWTGSGGGFVTTAGSGVTATGAGWAGGSGGVVTTASSSSFTTTLAVVTLAAVPPMSATGGMPASARKIAFTS